MGKSDKGIFTPEWHANVRRVLEEVKDERVRQHNKFGTQNHSIERWFLVLGEEYGEANTDALEAGLANDPQRLWRCRKELLEVAAVAVVMVESLDRNELKDVPRPKQKDDKPSPPPEQAYNFEHVYKALYPRKQGKVDGLKLCEKQIKNGIDYEAWVRSVRNYSEYHAKLLAPGEFRPEPMHFDTFMRGERWREFVDPDWTAWALNSKAERQAPACELDGHTRSGVPLCKTHSYGISECKFAKEQPPLVCDGGHTEMSGERLPD